MKEDWCSGRRLWVVDLVAPFGHARAVCRELRSRFRDYSSAKALRMDSEGRYRKLAEFRRSLPMPDLFDADGQASKQLGHGEAAYGATHGRLSPADLGRS
jgi:hypothetical protein